MNDAAFAMQFIKELEAEVASTKKCIERFSMDLFKWKPHERSMEMGYLVQLCAEIPLWIAYMVNTSEIDLMTFDHIHPSTTQELVDHFTENVAKARAALEQVEDGSLSAIFELKTNGKVVQSSTKRESIESTINHMVHHRGQLTVYMRLNDIAVPSIYGPSADDKTFG